MNGNADENAHGARLFLLGRTRKGDEGDDSGDIGIFNIVTVGVVRLVSGLFLDVGETDNLHHYVATVSV